MVFLNWLKSFFASDRLKPAPQNAVSAPTVVSSPMRSAGSVQGIDVSHYESRLDWPTIKKNVSFAIMKATQGFYYKDATFDQDWVAAKTNGILRGAYHVFDGGLDPVRQAQFFMNAVGHLEPGDLPCTLDWEQSLNKHGNASACLIFLAEVERLSGKIPMIYGSPSALEEMNFPPQAARYPLWIANYGVTTPKVPKPWSKWTLWQFTDAAKVGGVGNCDTNYFNGTMDELKKANFA